MIRNLILSFMLLSSSVFALKNGDTVPLWHDGAPGSEAMAGKAELVTAPAKAGDSLKVSSIHNPSLMVYLPPKEKATGAAMIIAPGGGHRFLSIDSEGTNVAEWLNSIGVAAFVLKYRLAREEGSTYKITEHAYADGQRAIRMVRARAAEWNVNPAKVGVTGFSAGGEVAVMVSTRFDSGKADAADPVERQSSKPDYQILIYPGIRADTVTVTKDTPPTFLLCAGNDTGPAAAISGLYPMLKKAGVPTELHIYNSGGHGWGYRAGAMPIIRSSWVLRLQDWMNDVGMSPLKQ